MEDHTFTVCWQGPWADIFSPWRVALIGWHDQARIVGQVARAFGIEAPGVEFRREGPPKERGRIRKQKFGRVIELYPAGWDAATLGHLLVHAVVAHHMKREGPTHDPDFDGVARMVEVELKETVSIGSSVKAYLLLDAQRAFARVLPGAGEQRAAELGVWREDREGFELSLSGAARLARELGSVHVTGLDRRVNPRRFRQAVDELPEGDEGP